MGDPSAKVQSHLIYCGSKCAAVHPLALRFFFIWPGLLLQFLPQDTTPTVDSPSTPTSGFTLPSLFGRASRVCKGPSKKSSDVRLQLFQRCGDQPDLPLVPARCSPACRNAVKGLLNTRHGRTFNPTPITTFPPWPSRWRAFPRPCQSVNPSIPLRKNRHSGQNPICPLLVPTGITYL